MKLNKSKKYTIFGISLAALAISSVGLATWLTGLTQEADSADVQVQVDVVKDSTKYVSIALADGENGLTFCESGELSLDGNRLIGFTNNNSKKADLSVNLKEFNFVYSKDSFEFEKLTLKLSLNDVSSWPTFTRKEDNALKEETTKKTFIDLEGASELADGGYGLEITSSNFNTYFEKESSYTGYDYSFMKFKQSALTFKWGSLFDNGSPATFYNTKFSREDTTIDKVNKLEEVKTELETMNSAFEGETLKIEVSLSLTEKASA